jgi:hypothetical protein
MQLIKNSLDVIVQKLWVNVDINNVSAVHEVIISKNVFIIIPLLVLRLGFDLRKLSEFFKKNQSLFLNFLIYPSMELT